MGALRAKGEAIVTPALLHDVFKELGVEKAIVPEAKEADGEAKEEGEEGEGGAAEGTSDAPAAEPQFTNHAAALLAALGALVEVGGCRQM